MALVQPTFCFFFFPRHCCEVFGVVWGFLGSWLLSCGIAHPTVTLFFS